MKEPHRSPPQAAALEARPEAPWIRPGPRQGLPAATLMAALCVAVLAGDPASVLARKKAPKEEPKAVTALPDLAAKTRGLERREGFLTLHLDPEKGKVWLEVPPPAGPEGIALELLYVEGLATGLGSNPVGLDRGQLDEARSCVCGASAREVLLEQPNLALPGASPTTPPSGGRRRSRSPPRCSGPATIAALDPDGRSLVDFTSFWCATPTGGGRSSATPSQGSFTPRPGPQRRRPGELPGVSRQRRARGDPDLRRRRARAPTCAPTAPTPEAVTLVQHHSLIRLPDDGYRPRRFDPRAGSFAIDFRDYAARARRAASSDAGSPATGCARPIPAPSARRRSRADRLLRRSRRPRAGAQRADRGASAGGPRPSTAPASSTPSASSCCRRTPIRWTCATTSIQWVHRSTRGWSYGGGVIDPRTGEILKGHVSLGSLRVRQDRLLFEGLAGTAKTGSGAPDDPIELALARIRQLAAHEVGHTLGLDHNFAASTYGGRASVMDYPAPLVTVDDGGELDFSRAYGVGVGAWDVHAIRYAYGESPPAADEAATLDAHRRGGASPPACVFLGRRRTPARPGPPSRGPTCGTTATTRWRPSSETLAGAPRRPRALRRGQRAPRRRPWPSSQEVLAPVYFHHRYQLDAAAKVIGGLEYTYALRGDGQDGRPRSSRRPRQRRALEVVLGVLRPRAPRPAGVGPARCWRRGPSNHERHREMFASATEPAFDALGAAATAADQVVRALLAARAARSPGRLPPPRPVAARRRGGARRDARAAPSRRRPKRAAAPRRAAPRRAAGGRRPLARPRPRGRRPAGDPGARRAGVAPGCAAGCRTASRRPLTALRPGPGRRRRPLLRARRARPPPRSPARRRSRRRGARSAAGGTFRPAASAVGEDPEFQCSGRQSSSRRHRRMR